jgi:NDP-sugar pyrophosphorylase family protein
MKTTVFPVREYWMDIGQMKDYERANGEYCVYFADGKQ